MPRVIPTEGELLDIRTRALQLGSARLIALVDARNEALRLLDPPRGKVGTLSEPDVEGALKALNSTRRS